MALPPYYWETLIGAIIVMIVCLYVIIKALNSLYADITDPYFPIGSIRIHYLYQVGEYKDVRIYKYMGKLMILEEARHSDGTLHGYYLREVNKKCYKHFNYKKGE